MSFTSQQNIIRYIAPANGPSVSLAIICVTAHESIVDNMVALYVLSTQPASSSNRASYDAILLIARIDADIPHHQYGTPQS